jgi:PiT family inorganic phosphate transporter
MIIGILLVSTLLLAFVNGANDNFKGVATLYGSGALSYRAAVALAGLSTAIGALSSVMLASGLVKAFSAKGLVPDSVIDPTFLAAVALGAALTVLAATRLGMPVSTTHALVGGLVGAGLVGAGSSLNGGSLGRLFVLPLLLSPLAAVPLANLGYRAGRWGRERLGIEESTCVCVGQEWIPIGNATSAVAEASGPTLRVGAAEDCERRYQGNVAGVSAHGVVTVAHAASASLVGFARGLNDTPKMVGLLAGASVASPWNATLAITGLMILGGLVASRRVALTMSRKITTMNAGQGFAGNVATSLLVAGASHFGLPVSTTHVSTGSIFGIGAARGGLRWGTVGAILTAWVTTLPLAALLSASAFWVLRSF